MVLAKWCFNGDILPKNHAEAVRWYEMAAKQGNAEAMMALAKMLNDGDGNPKDVRKGCEWYVAAARKGNAEAYLELGGIFENGDGVTADKDKAIRLYEEGAKRGNAEAALRLARIYESASGPGDAEKRDHYLELASALGSDADKESVFLGGLYNQMQNQTQDRAMKSQRSPADHTDEWGFDVSDGQIASTASEDTSAGQPYVITEEDRRYDQELLRRAEQEWNENARKTGGPMFVGEPGSGIMEISNNEQARYETEQRAHTQYVRPAREQIYKDRAAADEATSYIPSSPLNSDHGLSAVTRVSSDGRSYETQFGDGSRMSTKARSTLFGEQIITTEYPDGSTYTTTVSPSGNTRTEGSDGSRLTTSTRSTLSGEEIYEWEYEP